MDEKKFLRSIYGDKLFQANSQLLGIKAEAQRDNIEQLGRVGIRVHSIADAIIRTLDHNQNDIIDAVDVLAEWMKDGHTVRVLGAGRALIAASLGGNRLAHGGAQVSFMGGIVPMPNSVKGGGIIASSASGKTKAVLEAMEIAKRNNEDIFTIGFANNNAQEFAALCDIFIGIHPPVIPAKNPLSALADQEELIIAELLDAIVVLAGQNIGFDDDSWRKGHEDIGPTGPYSPKSNNQESG